MDEDLTKLPKGPRSAGRAIETVRVVAGQLRSLPEDKSSADTANECGIQDPSRYSNRLTDCDAVRPCHRIWEFGRNYSSLCPPAIEISGHFVSNHHGLLVRPCRKQPNVRELDYCGPFFPVHCSVRQVVIEQLTHAPLHVHGALLVALFTPGEVSHEARP
jgi:hypothetical protein